MRRRRGAALLLAIGLTAWLMTLAVMAVKMVYNEYGTAVNLLRREEAFWLAETGLAAGEARLRQNPGWFTDLPHYLEDDSRWLKGAAVGVTENFHGGRYKIVKERGCERLYAVGRKGPGVVVLKVTAAKWSEI